ncbi:MAG: hypothetical protein ABID84_00075 [Chloroflexota bacterium]
MPKYRKLPVVVEAVQWWPGDQVEGVVEGTYQDGPFEGRKFAVIVTLEGEHMVSPGDFIITGVKGERYPCKPDIFDATYELE